MTWLAVFGKLADWFRGARVVTTW